MDMFIKEIFNMKPLIIILLFTGVFFGKSQLYANYAYVANSGSNTVSQINTNNVPPSVTNTFSVGSSPQAVAITPDGSQVFVANQGATTLSVISISGGGGGSVSTISGIGG